MPSFSKSLAFSQASDITFSNNGSEVDILVGSILLGKINSNFPVTVYVEIKPDGTKLLCLKEITQAQYTYNNDASRTVILHFQSSVCALHIGKCSTSDNYKMIGTDDENTGGICMSGNSRNYYDVNNPMNFKSMIEMVNISGTNEPRLFARYSVDMMNACSGSEPECSSNLFCYVCIH